MHFLQCSQAVKAVLESKIKISVLYLHQRNVAPTYVGLNLVQTWEKLEFRRKVCKLCLMHNIYQPLPLKLHFLLFHLFYSSKWQHLKKKAFHFCFTLFISLIFLSPLLETGTSYLKGLFAVQSPLYFDAMSLVFLSLLAFSVLRLLQLLFVSWSWTPVVGVIPQKALYFSVGGYFNTCNRYLWIQTKRSERGYSTCT